MARPQTELEQTLNKRDRENTVADLIEWLKTQDQTLIVEVQVKSHDKTRHFPLPWSPELTEIMDFTNNPFSEGKAWNKKKFLLLGER